MDEDFFAKKEKVQKPILITGHGLSMEDLNTVPLFKSNDFKKYIPTTKGFEDAMKDDLFRDFTK